MTDCSAVDFPRAQTGAYVTHVSGLGRFPRAFAAAIAVAALLAAAGCDSQPQPMSAPALPPPEVAVLTVQPQSVALTAELPGRACAFLVAEIRPEVSGLIRERLFTEGADVQAGQTLYQIDPAMFQAALDNATANLASARKAAERAQAALMASAANVAQQQATLALAETNRQRFENLAQGGAVSLIERDQAVTAYEVAKAALEAAQAGVESDRKAVAAAEAAVQQAEAALKAAKINLNYTKIAAPISGRIGRSNVTVGAIVTAYQSEALATIQQLDPIYVDVTQSAAELLRLQRSLQEGRLNQDEANPEEVSLILEDGSAYPQKGRLQFRDVTVDSATGSVILRAVFPNPDGVVLPGMFVRAVIKTGVNDKAILVPQQAVARDPRGDPYALIVDAESKVAVRPLTLDRAMGAQWLVASGLAPGDRVIVEGLQRARPGMTVTVAPADDGQTPPGAPEGAAGQPRAADKGGA